MNVKMKDPPTESSWIPNTPVELSNCEEKREIRPSLQIWLSADGTHEVNRLNRVAAELSKNQVLVVDLSCHNMTKMLQKNDQFETGSNTPLKRPRNIKHRPKVKVEGPLKPKRGIAKAARSEKNNLVKRKYTRKSKASTQWQGDNPTEGKSQTDPGSPRPKRVYTRRKGAKEANNNVTPVNVGGTTSPERTRGPRRSCRRSLKFDSGYVSDLDSKSTSRISYAGNQMASEVKLDELVWTGTCLNDDLAQSRKKGVEDYTPNEEMKNLCPSTPVTFDHLHNKSMAGSLDECSRAKYPYAFNSSSDILSQERCARGKKRRLISYAEEGFLEVWQSNGCEEESPTLHSPIIYTRKKTTNLQRSTTSSAPLTNASTNSLASQEARESNRMFTCMDALVADKDQRLSTKKRSRRNLSVPPSMLSMSPVDAIFAQSNCFDMPAENQIPAIQEKNALIAYNCEYPEQNALAIRKSVQALIPSTGSHNRTKERGPRPKVNLEKETTRVWNLLLEDINSEGIDGTDEEKRKWWQEERGVFSGRAKSFIAKIYQIQGDRHFSPWKGSIVDSVVGVFLTQNVADHLSSSAFMSMAARFPVKPAGSQESCCESSRSSDSPECGPSMFKEVKISEFDSLNDRRTTLDRDQRVSDDISSSQNSVVSCQSSIDSVAQTANKKQLCSHNFLEEKCTSECCRHTSSLVQTREQRVYIPGDRKASGLMETRTTSDETGKKLEIKKSYIHVNLLKLAPFCPYRSFVHVTAGGAVHKDFAGPANNSSPLNLEEIERCVNQRSVTSDENKHVNLTKKAHGVNAVKSESKGGKKGKQKQEEIDWDKLRKQAQAKGRRYRTVDTSDSVDWESVRCADVEEIADTIKGRGMNNKLAERIKDFLNRTVKDHGSIDLEWLRDVPPDEAKEYLLSIRGLGLKSVECVRLLTLHQLAFPVDTNVGRIAVRLGWVPLQPLPESLQLHLLDLYPILKSIQKYLWPRLCKLDILTLYELHYHMITFGKVFCTKRNPNCNSCPLRGECRHFASAYASSRLTLPATKDTTERAAYGTKEERFDLFQLTGFQSSQQFGAPSVPIVSQPMIEVSTRRKLVTEESEMPEPIIEEPQTPEAEAETMEPTQFLVDIEDIHMENDVEIPTVHLNLEALNQNLLDIIRNSVALHESEKSNALVVSTPEAASIPMPKLKKISRLRTEHQVYLLPDSHQLLKGLEKREQNDPCPYLLAIWAPGETVDSVQPPQKRCNLEESNQFCSNHACSSCNARREASSQTVRGTLFIPCRTAMRGNFPLNGTYFQVNEVFADHETSLKPIDVPREWLWNLRRGTVYFGTSVSTIFKGLELERIMFCFWKGFVCVRGFDRATRTPKPLVARLHVSASQKAKNKEETGESSMPN